MALLRLDGFPCRFHGFTIHKRLQKGVVTGWAYTLAPTEIIHSWVEVFFDGRWLELEGFILDQPYLRAIQQAFTGQQQFCGYGIGTLDLSQPPVAWRGQSTYIQKEGIVRDFGIFDDPDTFYAQHGTNLTGLRRRLFEQIVRHRMNQRVDALRRKAITPV